MAKTSYNEKLNTSKDLPKVKFVGYDPEMVKRFGGGNMLIAAPVEYDGIMKKGKRYFVKDYREKLMDL